MSAPYRALQAAPAAPGAVGQKASRRRLRWAATPATFRRIAQHKAAAGRATTNAAARRSPASPITTESYDMPKQPQQPSPPPVPPNARPEHGQDSSRTCSYRALQSQESRRPPDDATQPAVLERSSLTSQRSHANPRAVSRLLPLRCADHKYRSDDNLPALAGGSSCVAPAPCAMRRKVAAAPPSRVQAPLAGGCQDCGSNTRACRG